MSCILEGENLEVAKKFETKVKIKFYIVAKIVEVDNKLRNMMSEIVNFIKVI